MSKYAPLEDITNEISFDGCLIDMIIGLQGNGTDVRPDPEARREMKGRASTIFPAPCRAAVYGVTKAERLDANVKVLGKKFTSQTDAIIPKIREVDEFLQTHSTYKNEIMESHPEVCFARLNGEVLMTSKHTNEGIRDRSKVLSKYLTEVTYEDIKEMASSMKCNMDDITDSICLAIVSNLYCQGKTETIPARPMQDETGLLMQMVVPKRDRYLG
jgi:8-oxo-dGTP diphosphatase